LYLLDCLQIENHKATNLLRSISPLDERLRQDDEPSFERRKVKKRLSWLRHRFGEINRQEKIILRQLGQVTFEIQTRAKWTQIELERRQSQIELYNGFYGMQQALLNPESPTFTPQGYQIPNTSWTQGNGQKWQSRGKQQGREGNYRPATEKYFSYSSEFATECSPSDERISTDSNTTTDPLPNQHGSRECSMMHRSSSLNSAFEQLEVFPTNTTATSLPQARRLSLPSFPVPMVPGMNIWDFTPSEKDGDIQGLFKDGAQAEGS
jgi:hypothetical protein